MILSLFLRYGAILTVQFMRKQRLKKLSLMDNNCEQGFSNFDNSGTRRQTTPKFHQMRRMN